EEDVEPLAGKLKDADPTVRQRAARGLGHLRAGGAVSGLVAALAANRGRIDGYGPQIRTEIVRTLGRIGDRSAVPHLVAELGLKEDLSYKNVVVEVLGVLGDARAAGPIREHLAELERNKPSEKIALFPWQEAVEKAREALRKLGG
ncbi:MAG: HEAT repeat domain-containing protein, partial [Planctomycetota bacterium]